MGGRGRAHRACPAQSLMLAKAKECWEQEHEAREAEKSRYLAERIPALQTRGLSLSALQVGRGDGLPKRARSPEAGAQTGLAPSSLISLHNPVGRGRAGVGRWVPFYEREGSLSREEGLACGGGGGGGGAEQGPGRVSEQRDGAERGAGQRLGGPTSPDLPVLPLQIGL